MLPTNSIRFASCGRQSAGNEPPRVKQEERPACSNVKEEVAHPENAEQHPSFQNGMKIEQEEGQLQSYVKREEGPMQSNVKIEAQEISHAPLTSSHINTLREGMKIEQEEGQLQSYVKREEGPMQSNVKIEAQEISHAPLTSSHINTLREEMAASSTLISAQIELYLLAAQFEYLNQRIGPPGLLRDMPAGPFNQNDCPLPPAHANIGAQPPDFPQPPRLNALEAAAFHRRQRAANDGLSSVAQGVKMDPGLDELLKTPLGSQLFQKLFRNSSGPDRPDDATLLQWVSASPGSAIREYPDLATKIVNVYSAAYTGKLNPNCLNSIFAQGLSIDRVSQNPKEMRNRLNLVEEIVNTCVETGNLKCLDGVSAALPTGLIFRINSKKGWIYKIPEWIREGTTFVALRDKIKRAIEEEKSGAIK